MINNCIFKLLVIRIERLKFVKHKTLEVVIFNKQFIRKFIFSIVKRNLYSYF